MAVTEAVNCACSDTTNNKTLLQLRTDLMARLGFGAQAANPPPGMAVLLNGFLTEAQELLYHRPTGEFRGERFYSWPLTVGVRKYNLPLNSETAEIATPVAPTTATATTGGTLAAATHSYRITGVNANGETLASVAKTQVTTGSTSTVTVTFPAVVPIAAGGSAQTGWKVYGRVGGGELLMASVGLVASWTDIGSVTPLGALPSTNTTAICLKTLNPRQIDWVGTERDGIWRPLAQGINPVVYSNNITDRPERYEIRQCIELWPAPEVTAGNLVIKGRFELEPFAADADKTTINSRAVFLLALANAKAHYRQPDASNYVQQLEVLIDNLVAGTHGTARYVPGAQPAGSYPYPMPSVPFP